MHLETLFSVLLLLLTQVTAQEGVCWGVDGKQWTDNKRCPGSSACCGEGATCMPNRLCKNKGQGENEFVRGPCAVAPYDKKKCAAICVYEERNNRFPRVKRCDDRSYCCSDDDPGCCDSGRGVFLDSKGNLEFEDNSTTTVSVETTSSSSSSVTTSTSSLLLTTTSLEPSATSDEETQETDEADAGTTDDGQGMKIGLGVGIPAVAIIAALSVWVFLRRRPKGQTSPATQVATSHYYPGSEPRGHANYPPPQMYHQQYSEMYEQRATKSPATVQELQG